MLAYSRYALECKHNIEPETAPISTSAIVGGNFHNIELSEYLNSYSSVHKAYFPSNTVPIMCKNKFKIVLQE
jgi:hypothetical protein